MNKKLFLSVCMMFLLFGCSSSKVDETNPESLYQDAMSDVSDKRYLVAIEKLKAVKNKFPYSNFAVASKLAIADVYFKEESYIEAAAAYESFRDLHPKNEKSDYVLFQIAESYYLQLPDSEDRDMTAGKKSIDAYKEMLTVYPKSTHAQTAREHMQDALNRLASKDYYIADFYYKRAMYESSSKRFEKIIDQYSGSSAEEDAYLGLGRSLLRQEKNDEADHIFKVYLSKFPTGKYVKRIQARFKDE